MGRQTPGSVDAAWQIVHMADEDNDGVATDALTRRRLLRAGAIGAGVAGAAWVAPSVVTMDAAAAASGCTPGSAFNWESYNNNDAGLVTDVAGVRITITTSPGSQAVAPNMVVQTQAGSGANFGARSRWWQMRQNAIDAGNNSAPAQQTATFTFTQTANPATPVLLSQLTFNLLDVDLQVATANNGGGWRDELWVTDAAGAAIPFTFVLASPTNGPTGAGTAGNRWVGQTGNIANGSPDGNVAISFTNPVSGFRVNYRNRRQSAGDERYEGNIMRVGISELDWCRAT